jgi:hypothetical protein
MIIIPLNSLLGKNTLNINRDIQQAESYIGMVTGVENN